MSAEIIQMKYRAKPLPLKNLRISNPIIARAQLHCQFRRNGIFCYPHNEAAEMLVKVFGHNGWMHIREVEGMQVFVEIEYL